MTHIANDALRKSAVPPVTADWLTIWTFALSFDGYTHWGSFERCADIANARNPQDLTEFRTCLFFEQRRWRHFGEEPDPEATAHIASLLDGIRALVPGS